MTVRILTGDAVSVLQTMPAESVNCCVTSPPYFGLRQYFGDAVRIKAALSPEKRAWIEAQLNEAGVHAHY